MTAGHGSRRTTKLAAGYELCPSCGLRALWSPCCVPEGAVRQPNTECCECTKARLAAETARLLAGAQP